ncbi:MAG: hypothetical protein K9L17_03515 [Clostridiales bacterium]|nr:hypothetical protein [Clostridiales bacterium]MCF8021748.1 hypothetical protein [Clostridiales bacterium]
MSRSGRIDFDTDDTNFNGLRFTLLGKVVPIFDDITYYIKKNYPELKCATGSWYINYGFDKKIIFFKIEPAPKNNCIYIAVHDEDHSQLTEETRQHVLLKPGSDPLKPGNWKRQATIKTNSDMKWAYKLIDEIYNLS